MAKKSKKTIPLFKIIQGLLVMEELSGNHVSPIIDQLVMVMTGERAELGHTVSVNIRSSINYLKNYPTQALLHAAQAAIITQLISKLMQVAGVPKKVDIGVCYISIR